MRARPLVTSTSGVLNSWKQIATYLNRGVRTVQRWEAQFGLPVRRPSGKSRSAVIAIPADLDRWLLTCPLAIEKNSGLQAPMRKEVHPREPISFLIQHSRGLRREMAHNKIELKQSLKNLRGTLERLNATRAAWERRTNRLKSSSGSLTKRIA